MGLVRVTDLAAEAAPQARLPALLLLGDRDEIVPNDRVEAVFARVPGPRETIRYEDGWHLLFRDLQAPRVWDDVADWALAREAPACPARVAEAG
jgi:alpha-beta hydrolase superfamily lysophospholipase